jgi:hypothetical protein
MWIRRRTFVEIVIAYTRVRLTLPKKWIRPIYVSQITSAILNNILTAPYRPIVIGIRL